LMESIGVAEVVEAVCEGW